MQNHLVFLLLTVITSSSRAESEHRTKAASEKVNDLYCYKCDTVTHQDRCLDLKDNSSSLYVKCPQDQRICQVQTITMSSTTDETKGKPKLWLLQRNCSKSCEPVCVTIGERTKLRACNTCCETSFCNTGNKSGRVYELTFKLWISMYLFVVLLAVTFFNTEKYLKNI